MAARTELTALVYDEAFDADAIESTSPPAARLCRWVKLIQDSSLLISASSVESHWKATRSRFG